MLALALGGVALAALLGLILAAQPFAANAFGYALGGKDGLPDHFGYLNIRYSNAQLCAGASSCEPATAERWTKTQLGQHGLWPARSR